MGSRSKSAKRCPVCRLHEADCLCPYLRPITTISRLVLVMHHRELAKPTSTGPLALAALPNSEHHLHGLRDRPLDLTHLHTSERRLLVLFPSEKAVPLSPELIQADPRPVSLIVPDGNWRQARRIPQRVPGLPQLPTVTLPAGGPSRWGVRNEPTPEGLATFEAIARAFGILEGPVTGPRVQAELEALFERLVAATLAARGSPSRPAPAQSTDHPPTTASVRPTGSQKPLQSSTPRQAPLELVHLDDHLVAINKPAGLAVHRGWSAEGLPILQRLRKQLGRHLYPVHRIDQATSGVLLFAFYSEVARDVQQLFAHGRVHKLYLSLCRGRSPELQRINHPLARSPLAEKQPACTEFHLLGSFERYGLYLVHPLTGRTHQIRRHLKHAGHPIVGDVRYGKGEHNRIFRERFGFHRLALHCRLLSFAHPRTSQIIRIEATERGSLAQLLAQLGIPVPATAKLVTLLPHA